tara:strand:+ start:187 stop:783 length:597 start_codon:yes stop_codon:yes gene_type:complete
VIGYDHFGNLFTGKIIDMNETQKLVVDFQYNESRAQYAKHVWKAVRQQYKLYWLFWCLIPVFIYLAFMTPAAIPGSDPWRALQVTRVLCLLYGAVVGCITFHTILIFKGANHTIRNHSQDSSVQLRISSDEFRIKDNSGIETAFMGEIQLAQTKDNWQMRVNNVYSYGIMRCGIDKQADEQLERLRLHIMKDTKQSTE